MVNIKLILLISFSCLLPISQKAQLIFQKKIAISGYSLAITKANTLGDGSYIACGMDMYLNLPPVIVKTDVSGQITWVKALSYADTIITPYDIGECVGGGYYLFGTANSNNSFKYYLSKLDVLGNVIWAKQFQFTDAAYSYPKFFQKQNGEFVIIPSSFTTMGIIILDANGNYLWGKQLSDGGKCPGFNGVLCPDGGYLISGKEGSDI